MTYESAPATALLATQCCVCGRPLLDAKSVELGIGPICRKKHGYNIADISDEARTAANGLVHRIAANGSTLESLADIAALLELGFDKLAGKIEARMTSITIKADGGVLSVKAPYDVDFVSAVKSIRGRRWNKETKTWGVPASERRALWNALKAYYPGVLAIGPKGAFQVAA